MTPIHFTWNDQTYTIPEAKYPIFLPTGDVLTGNDWFETVPEQPRQLQLLYPIRLDSKTSLTELAARLGAVLATAVTVVTEVICPNNCQNPTFPYCKNCGSKVDTVPVYLPYIPPPPPPFQNDNSDKDTKDVILPGLRCPHCGVKLNHSHKTVQCPSCHGSIRWTCR